MMHSKYTTAILLALLLVIGVVTVVQAAQTIPGSSISYTIYNEVYPYYSTGYFSSASDSWTSQAIGSIGWSVRSNQQLCGGTVVYGFSLPAVAINNSSHAYVGPSSSTSRLQNCPYGGSREVRVQTSHEFKVSGLSPFYAYGGDILPAP
jgi:hypothetical protein